jgi:dephospho-CoA kinase
MFERLGASVVDADVLSREVLAPGQPAQDEIRAAFGPQVIRPDGTVDRPRLAACIFSDAEARARLNAITHPRIAERMQQEIAAARAGGVDVLVAVIPLLLENDRRELVDSVIVVAVDEATQESRLVHRDGLTPDEARARMAAQMPLTEKARLADHVIDNSGTPEDTEAQVMAVWRQLTE